MTAPPDTRQRVLDVALRLFAERGYAATSVRDIAAELGVTKAAVYYHFPAKEQMVAALVRPFLLQLDAARTPASGSEHADPRTLLAQLQAAFLAGGPTMQILAQDPSIVVVAGLKEEVDACLARFADALRQRGAGAAAALRSHCAIGALFGGMSAMKKAAAPTEGDLAQILEAAVAALGSSPQGPTERAGRRRRSAT